MPISVVIPVYNLFAVTHACLTSLAQYSQGATLEVIVVDNGSTDETAQEIPSLGAKLWPNMFQYLRLPQNLGFARACNMGAKKARHQILFFCNNDITFRANWLAPLQAVLLNTKLAVVAPLLLYPDMSCQHCGISFTPFRTHTHIYQFLAATHPLLTQKRALQALTAAALLLPRDLFFSAGGFHEGYLNGYEDLDLCFVLKELGANLCLEPASVLVHHTSQTQGRFDNESQNIALFSERHGSKVAIDLPLFAAKDGLECHLALDGQSFLTYPAAQLQKLRAENMQNIGELACAVQEYPFWQEGYAALAEKLLLAHKTAEAEVVLRREALFVPPERLLQDLTHLSTYHTFQEVLRQTTAAIKQGQLLLKENAQKILFLRRQAIRTRNKLLERCYTQWMLSYYAQPSAGSESR